VGYVVRRDTKAGERRWQAALRVNGNELTRTFERKTDAETWLSEQRADGVRGQWVDPRKGQQTVATYARAWLEGRHDVAERTHELYGHLLERHILPYLGKTPLAALVPSKVQSWHGKLTTQHPTTAAKAYRLLRQVLSAAVADKMISVNPCQSKGAGVEEAPERPVASVAEVDALAGAMPAHMRALVLLAAWCQLRRGEILGLRRRDIDIDAATVTVTLTRTLRMDGKTVEKAPKTAAGRRTLAIPPNVLPALRDHLCAFVGPSADALVAVGEKGGPLAPQMLQEAFEDARQAIGRPDLHLHDLRHSGLTWSAATGASLADLMKRGGHASPRAALRYQHATADRDRALAEALGRLAN
jgi:integrase